MSIYIPLNLTHRYDPQDWGSSSIQVMWLIFYYVCMYLYIGGFAKVKAAIHKLTGEKVSYTGLQTYIYIHIYVLLNRLPLRLWIKFNLGWVRIHIYILVILPLWTLATLLDFALSCYCTLIMYIWPVCVCNICWILHSILTLCSGWFTQGSSRN